MAVYTLFASIVLKNGLKEQTTFVPCAKLQSNYFGPIKISYKCIKNSEFSLQASFILDARFASREFRSETLVSKGQYAFRLDFVDASKLRYIRNV